MIEKSFLCLFTKRKSFIHSAQYNAYDQRRPFIAFSAFKKISFWGRYGIISSNICHMYTKVSKKKKDGQIFATHLFNNSYLPFDLEWTALFKPAMEVLSPKSRNLSRKTDFRPMLLFQTIPVEWSGTLIFGCEKDYFS